MKTFIKNIVTLQFGYYERPLESGIVRYLQAKDFGETNSWDELTDTWLEVNEKSRKHLLQSGDVLFVGKGFRNFAWVYTEEIGPAIASSIFFVLRPDHQKAIPEYLAIVLNSERYQSFFQTLGAGSSIPSIRKNELEAVEISLPAMAEQQKVVKLNQMHLKSLTLYHQILNEKNKLHQALIHNIINQ